MRDFVDKQGETDGGQNSHQISDQIDPQSVGQHSSEIKVTENNFEVLEAVPGAGKHAFYSFHNLVILKGQKQTEERHNGKHQHQYGSWQHKRMKLELGRPVVAGAEALFLLFIH
jgi:hypothetical protein